MTLHTIALPLLSAAEAQWLAPAAAGLARAAGAHLVGIHPVEPVMLMAGMGYEAAIVPDITDWQTRETEAVADLFGRATAGGGFVAEFRAQTGMEVSAEDFLLGHLAAADLVLSGRCTRGGRPADRRLQERALRGGGRPVLVLSPGAVPALPVAHAVLGWSATREAVRAAHDLRMVLAPGATVDIVSVRSGSPLPPHEAALREDLAAALDRHGCRVTLIDREAAPGHAGECLARVALEQGADLLAAGAFGHSRAYDIVIGAVTSYLLDGSTLPVLLSR